MSIVERLRRHAEQYVGDMDTDTDVALFAAADEIERLRELVAETAWEFNEAVSLLNGAKHYVPDRREIDEAMPAIMAALKNAAAP